MAVFVLCKKGVGSYDLGSPRVVDVPRPYLQCSICRSGFYPPNKGSTNSALTNPMGAMNPRVLSQLS